MRKEDKYNPIYMFSNGQIEFEVMRNSDVMSENRQIVMVTV